MSTYVMEVPIAEMNLGRVAQINNLSGYQKVNIQLTGPC